MTGTSNITVEEAEQLVQALELWNPEVRVCWDILLSVTNPDPAHSSPYADNPTDKHDVAQMMRGELRRAGVKMPTSYNLSHRRSR